MYEQPGMPPYGPQQPSPGPRELWYRRYPKTVIGLGVLAVSIALGGPAHATTVTKTAQPVKTYTAAAAPTTAKGHPSCRAQAKAWVDGGANRQLNVLEADLKALGSAAQNFAGDVNSGGATSSDVSAVRSAAAAMRSAARKVGANPGPACIPGLRADLIAAAGGYSNAGLDAQDAMTKYSKGSQDAAASDLKSVSAEIAKGDEKMNAAGKALSAFAGS
jgi:hypothetical protein